nr:MAG TPA: hypothetical protein [Caudoviricetes sp.]
MLSLKVLIFLPITEAFIFNHLLVKFTYRVPLCYHKNLCLSTHFVKNFS